MVQIPGAGEFLDAGRVVQSIGLMPGQHVADFGCGSGFFTLARAKVVGSNGRVAAIDVMKEPLESVHTRAESSGLHNIDMIRADLEVLGGTKLPDGSQDCVMMKNVLFQSEKKAEMLAEAVRVLKPGGKLVVIDWAKGHGGFGPPDSLRSDEADVKSLCTGAGVRPDAALPVDQYHFGFIAIK
jgi:ubiquinone/menaquinone biosynthesis C-methylase UbiE